MERESRKIYSPCFCCDITKIVIGSVGNAYAFIFLSFKTLGYKAEVGYTQLNTTRARAI